MKKCRHHWILDPPTSKISIGVCKLCDETKVHSNMPNEKAFYREVIPGSGNKVLIKDIYIGKR